MLPFFVLLISTLLLRLIGAVGVSPLNSYRVDHCRIFWRLSVVVA